MRPTISSSDSSSLFAALHSLAMGFLYFHCILLEGKHRCLPCLSVVALKSISIAFRSTAWLSYMQDKLLYVTARISTPNHAKNIGLAKSGSRRNSD